MGQGKESDSQDPSGAGGPQGRLEIASAGTEKDQRRIDKI